MAGGTARSCEAGEGGQAASLTAPPRSGAAPPGRLGRRAWPWPRRGRRQPRWRGPQQGRLRERTRRPRTNSRADRRSDRPWQIERQCGNAARSPSAHSVPPRLRPANVPRQRAALPRGELGIALAVSSAPWCFPPSTSAVSATLHPQVGAVMQNTKSLFAAVRNRNLSQFSCRFPCRCCNLRFALKNRSLRRVARTDQ